MANGEQQEIERRQNGNDALVIRARTDSNAFILLYDIYYEKIFRYCTVRLGIKQISEDLTSRVFLLASADIRLFHGKTRRQFVQWLCDIATAQIKDYSGKNKFENPGIERTPTVDASLKERLKPKLLSAYGTGKSINIKNIVIAATILIALTAGIFSLTILNKKTPIKISKPVTTVKQPVTPPLPAALPQRKAIVKEEKTKIVPQELIAEDNEPAAIKIGGFVRNTLSEPIEDAVVNVVADGLTDTFKTDANGFWICEDMEANVSTISVTAVYSGYNMAEQPRIANFEQLKKLSFVTVLEKGIAVTGNVVDRQGNPLQATIIKGPFPNGGENKTLCDINGGFRFNKLDPGIEVLTVQCDKASPAVLPVDIKPDMAALTITLEPPNIITGQVVDVNGMPVEGVSVNVSSWQGVSSLQFMTKTDTDGFFQWDSAPADEVLFNIQKSHYMSIQNYAMQSGTEYKIVMQRPLKLSGTITGGKGDEQIQSFRITVGYYFEKDKISWRDEDTVIVSGNKYEIEITEPADFKLKIESDGFAASESPVFSQEQIPAAYDFTVNPEF